MQGFGLEEASTFVYGPNVVPKLMSGKYPFFVDSAFNKRLFNLVGPPGKEIEMFLDDGLNYAANKEDISQNIALVNYRSKIKEF